ncbi:DUF695 domain-containing protein [Mucilaginibacter lacusdianchii]|uniref:DUF695 domain-containing protein n=1 Tax=Mucilaginibacter lacusdianchii TaxID=2684211 RepID=UPI00131BA38B|nr:DUF695 domain-containing protein [Mucilaginibacter sp. JXJ CY 39]
MSLFKSLFTKKKGPFSTYSDFWAWFKENEKFFHKVVKSKGDIEAQFLNKLSPKLQEIRKDIFFLTGMLDENTVELILTADGVIQNIVFVEELVKAAPSIPGWKFTALKPPSKDSFGLKMAGYEFNCDNLSFYVNDDSSYPDEINLIVVYHNYNEDDKASIGNGIYLFLDNYLGELEFATTIDNLTITGKNEATKELIPINKLKPYLVWREKEFVEKYDAIQHTIDNDRYSILEGTLKDGKPLIAVMNTDLLNWNAKASHPWIADIEIRYTSENQNGMPDKATSALLEKIEDKLMEDLKDYEGFLNIGRETADNTRNIYLACKDFRKPAKIIDDLQKAYQHELQITYNIFKDKYWQSFNRFMNQ